MKKQSNTPSGLAGPKKHILICLLAALPIYILSVTYTKSVTTKDDEEAALIATVLCIGGLYIGRYFSQVWQSRPIPGWLIVLLSIVNVSALIWLFVHAEFPLRDRVYLNLLLFELPVFILSVTTGMLIKLSRLSVQNQLQEAKALAEQSQSELHLLQSQLSPHFLFNTLNNLYGMSISQPEKTPTLLLKLADLLRYSVYEAKELFVPLRDELAYIDNYIEFEKIRIGSKLALTTSIEHVVNPDVKIAPMLLIVFIENAFKHSRNTIEQKIAIDITLKLWGNSILFSVKNSYTANDKSDVLEKSSGLGLSNVKKRLDLLYPNAHDLAIQDADGFYSVQLQLRIK